MMAAAPPPAWENEEYLKAHGLPSGGKGALAVLKKLAPREGDSLRVAALIAELGSDDFDLREDAVARLANLGKRVEADIARAEKSTDPEVRRRATMTLDRLRGRPSWARVRALVRAVRAWRPEGAYETFLDLLAGAEDPRVTAEIYGALADFADGAVPGPLVAALKGREWERRAAAAFAAGRSLDTRPQDQVVRLAETDPVPEVRLRAAQGLLAGGSPAGLKALPGLLEKGSLSVAWQAEELLRYAAGVDSPKASVGRGSAGERELAAAAWQVWVERGADRCVLRDSPSRFHHLPRLALLFEDGGVGGGPLDGRVWLCGGDGRRGVRVDGLGDPLLRAPDAGVVRAGCNGPGGWRMLARLGVMPEAGKMSWREARERYLVLYAGDDEMRIGRARMVWPSGYGPRIGEVWEDGRVVWQISCERPACLVWLCPVLEAGFPGRGMEVPDLEETSNFVRWLRHPDAAARLEAATRLARRWTSPYICKAAREHLADADPEVRQYLLYAIMKGEKDDAVASIASVMPYIGDERCCGIACAILAAAGEKGVRLLIDAFERPAKGPRGGTARQAAVGALCGIRNDDIRLAIPTIRAAARDPDPKVRSRIVYPMGNNKVWRERFGNEFVLLSLDPDEKIRKEALFYLPQTRPAKKRAVPLLFRALRRAETRGRAVGPLAALAGDDLDVAGAIIRTTEAFGGPDMRQDAAWYLSVWASGRTAPLMQAFVKRCLRDSSRLRDGRTVQQAAIHAAGALKQHGRRLMPYLKEMWRRSPSSELRWWIIYSVRQISPDEAHRLQEKEDARRREGR
jgi:HEAT repeat protein